VLGRLHRRNSVNLKEAIVLLERPTNKVYQVFKVEKERRKSILHKENSIAEPQK
jgi:hypothetical protein